MIHAACFHGFHVAFMSCQVCEKEAKTKTFSKEGLAREQKVDPKEQAKTSTRGWLQDSCQMLGDQLEGFEADLEKLCAGKGEY